MSKVNIIFFNVPKNLPMIGELMRYYQGQDDFETADVSNPSEVSQLLSMSGNGVTIFKVENKPDLQAVVTDAVDSGTTLADLLSSDVLTDYSDLPNYDPQRDRNIEEAYNLLTQ